MDEMKELLQWIKSVSTMYTRKTSTDFEEKHFSKFQQAIEEGDVEAYVYEEGGLKGQVIVLKGEDLHQVTERNLVSFRKLNRRDRRKLDYKYGARHARDKVHSHIAH